MLQVYDRVIPSKSISSLLALAILALLLYAFQGLFEIFRGRLLVRIAGAFDEAVGAIVLARLRSRHSISKKAATDGSQSMQDFDLVRTFLASAGPSAILDLPWLPLYVGICFLFHPIVGMVAIAGGLVLLLLTFVTNLSTRASAKLVFDLASRRNNLDPSRATQRRGSSRNGYGEPTWQGCGQSRMMIIGSITARMRTSRTPMRSCRKYSARLYNRVSS